jgi:hypothetical protein
MVVNKQEFQNNLRQNRGMTVSHLSSFSYIDAEDVVGTLFQALSIAEPIKK